MQQCAQQHVLFALFLKTIKLMMVFSYLKFLSHLCLRVCLFDFEILFSINNFFILEYAEKIPFVKEAPAEQESKATAAAKKK
jgi:hypothetical protein